MRKFYSNISFILFIAAIAFSLLAFTPHSLSAQIEYVPLAPISGTTNPAGTTNLGTYLTAMFKIGVAAAGVLAFLMIVWGGFTYLSTDAITGKEEGKDYIKRAIGGLILAMVSYIILYTINPSLVELDIRFGTPAGTRQSIGTPVMIDNFFYNMTQADQEALRMSRRGELSGDLNKKIQDIVAKQNAGTATEADLQTLKDLEIVREGTVAINYISSYESQAFATLRESGLNANVANRGVEALNTLEADYHLRLDGMEQSGASPEQIAVVTRNFEAAKRRINQCIQYVRSGRSGNPPSPECKK